MEHGGCRLLSGARELHQHVIRSAIFSAPLFICSDRVDVAGYIADPRFASGIWNDALIAGQINGRLGRTPVEDGHLQRVAGHSQCSRLGSFVCDLSGAIGLLFVAFSSFMARFRWILPGIHET